MSGTAELTAAALIQRIEAGEYAREVILTAARGFLPLPQEELVAVLAFLASSSDEEVSQLARGSLSELPGRAVIEFAANENGTPDYLVMLLTSQPSNDVVEALIRNRAVPDEAVVALAAKALPAIQDVIVINQARIIRAPKILDALLANPQLSTDARRRALEVREEFFEKRARLEELRQLVALPDTDEGPVIADVALDEIADLLERAEGDAAEAAGLTANALNEDEKKDERKLSLWARIQQMTIAQKVMLAFSGDKTARGILVRERNRLVAAAAMRNPRMSVSEAEIIAGMRNLDDEVLRILSTRREWMSKYTIINVLCHNPKAPIGVVIPLINRLTLRDLKGLKDDKNVPEVVRQAARKFFVAKTQKA
jgi:hypothetical protein